ncbi:hypothetical protein [Nocardia wallacei]|uniref:hypothetical protein n=1 Tax=Nocardia wallacei TaxID=480035 RepID=UPI0024553796|nr:hypothetical protein [Nocardia wallacei]
MPEPRTMTSIDHLDFPVPCMACLIRGVRTPAEFEWDFHGGCMRTVLCTYCSAAYEARYRRSQMRYRHLSCPKCGGLFDTFAQMVDILRLP